MSNSFGNWNPECSPGDPTCVNAPYANNLDCEYLLECPPTQPMTLTFSEFDVAGNRASPSLGLEGMTREKDYLKVCRYVSNQFGVPSRKCVSWSIVTRDHVPRQVYDGSTAAAPELAHIFGPATASGSGAGAAYTSFETDLPAALTPTGTTQGY
jgi:hypothetical protein